MTFLSVLLWVLLELGVGSALFGVFQRTGEIRKSFFSFMSLLATVCFVLISFLGMSESFYRSTSFPPAVFCAFASYHFSRERYGTAKWMLAVAIVMGFLHAVLTAMVAPTRTGSAAWTVLSFGLGTFLFGWSNGAMVLGHWYLVMRGLSFSHFQRANVLLLVALGLRWLGFFAGYLIFPENEARTDGLLLAMRPLWGLLTPSVFAFMAWRCSLIGSNQAGTGLLYIAEVAVLIGEILAGFAGF